MSSIRGDLQNLVTLAINDQLHAIEYKGTATRYDFRGYRCGEQNEMQYFLRERSAHTSRHDTIIVLVPEIAEQLKAQWPQDQFRTFTGTLTLKSICERFLGQKLAGQLKTAAARAKAQRALKTKLAASRRIVRAVEELLQVATDQGYIKNADAAMPVSEALIEQLRQVLKVNAEFVEREAR